MKNRKFTIAIFALIAAAVVCVGAVFAWYAIGAFVGNMNFKIAKIHSTVSLYKANDTNYNGIPDLDAEGKFDFSLIGTQDALSNTSASITYNADIIGALPSRIFTYKLALENKGDIANSIRISLEKYAAADTSAAANGFTSDNIKNLSILSVSVGTGLEDGTLTDKKTVYLQNGITDSWGIYAWNNTEIIGESDIISIDGLLTATGDSNKKDIWIQFRVEPYAELVANGTPLLTEDEYFSLQGKNLRLPVLDVYFEVFE